jgi:hypothetical protein
LETKCVGECPGDPEDYDIPGHIYHWYPL